MARTRARCGSSQTFSSTPLDTFVELLFSPLKTTIFQHTKKRSSRYGQILGGGGGGGVHLASQPAIFKYVFDEFNFFIISNLFANNRKCPNKMHHIR